MRWWVAGLLLIVIFAPTRVRAQGGPGINIASPASGAVLTGLVEVTGSSTVESFFSAEISFAYASDLTNWFLIATSEQPVTDGPLATWDTNAVTDGDYVLRLRVTTQDFSVQETFVTGLQIRNQTPAETATFAPTETFSAFSTSAPQPTQTQRPPLPVLPSPTSLAPNPASVSQPDIFLSLQRGLLFALTLFIFTGIVLRIRKT